MDTMCVFSPMDRQALVKLTQWKALKLTEESITRPWKISLMEIYNETIKDLFTSQTKKLEIKQGTNGMAYVPDLTWIEVTNYYEVEKYLESGSKMRAVAATNLNEHSSRSHLIYSIKVTGRNILENQVFTSKLNLIDLAGR
jgi:kinesin family member C2/C3